MAFHWPAFWGGFWGKLLAVVFVAVCTLLGFGPDKWVEFMTGGLAEWFTPDLARLLFIGLAVVVAVLTIGPWFRQPAGEHTAKAGKKSPSRKKQASQLRISYPTLLFVFPAIAAVGIILYVNRTKEPATWIVANGAKMLSSVPITPEMREATIKISMVNLGIHPAKETVWGGKALWWVKSAGPAEAMIETSFRHLKEDLTEKAARGESMTFPQNVGDSKTFNFPLTPRVVGQLLSGDGRIYVIQRAQWSDRNGTHGANHCQFLDPQRNHEFFLCNSDY